MVSLQLFDIQTFIQSPFPSLFVNLVQGGLLTLPHPPPPPTLIMGLALLRTYDLEYFFELSTRTRLATVGIPQKAGPLVSGLSILKEHPH